MKTAEYNPFIQNYHNKQIDMAERIGEDGK